MLVATAAAELLDPDAAHPSPADAVWLPLESTGGGTGERTGRREPHRLLEAWPNVPPPITDIDPASHPDTPVVSPPPLPMPPTDTRLAATRVPSSGR